MTALFILAAVALLALGGVGFLFLTIRAIIRRTLSGRPVMVTLPGNRPGTSVSYQVTARGWRRITPRPHIQHRVNKALARIKRSQDQLASLGVKKVEPELAQPVEETDA